MTVCLQASPEQQVIQELEVENILAVLPAFPRGAPLQRARRAAQALSRAANYSVLMAQQQVGVLRERKERRRETDSQLYWLVFVCLALSLSCAASRVAVVMLLCQLSLLIFHLSSFFHIFCILFSHQVQAHAFFFVVTFAVLYANRVSMPINIPY